MKGLIRGYSGFYGKVYVFNTVEKNRRYVNRFFSLIFVVS